MLIELSIIIAFLFLGASSINDLRTSEIPEILSHGLFALLFLLALIGAFQNSDPYVFLKPVSLGVLFFLISAGLFYMGQWGGGDVKLMAGIGVHLGLLNELGHTWQAMTLMPYPVAYWVNMAFLSIPYVVVYTFILGILKPKVFQEFILKFKTKKVVFYIALSFIPTLISSLIALPALELIYLLLPLFVVGTVYLKTCEEVALMKEINTSELVEGDIVCNDVFFEGEKIASKKCIEGLTVEQLQQIQGLASDGVLPQKIMIKWGVKFAPILLAALVTTIYFGNLMEKAMFWIFTFIG